MRIEILFNHMDVSALVRDTGLWEELRNAAGKIDNDAVELKILTEETMTGVPDTVKVLALFSWPDGAMNKGDALLAFKREAIRVFTKYGFRLERDELLVKIGTRCAGDDAPKKKSTAQRQGKAEQDEYDYDEKAKMFVPTEPSYSFERVILSEEVKGKIEEAIGILQCENKVFHEWGLYEIQPHPSTSLSFYGPSGTGKTMAAEAVAQKLGKKILKVSYADVESKYHGEGPKMVKAIFLAAERDNAVLFFDEADSLLSKRLTNVTQGSEQAINSMRSQLLICLEEYHGIVIFATNLVVNYDEAFLTRLISIEFKVPDVAAREKIWAVHTKAPDDGKPHRLCIPLTDDVDLEDLAERYEFVGREIRNAVVSACVGAAMAGKEQVTQADLTNACDKITAEKADLERTRNRPFGSGAAQTILQKAVQQKLEKEAREENVSEDTQ